MFSFDEAHYDASVASSHCINMESSQTNHLEAVLEGFVTDKNNINLEEISLILIELQGIRNNQTALVEEKEQ